jgi:hypothetical protein
LHIAVDEQSFLFRNGSVKTLKHTVIGGFQGTNGTGRTVSQGGPERIPLGDESNMVPPIASLVP